MKRKPSFDSRGLSIAESLLSLPPYPESIEVLARLTKRGRPPPYRKQSAERIANRVEKSARTRMMKARERERLAALAASEADAARRAQRREAGKLARAASGIGKGVKSGPNSVDRAVAVMADGLGYSLSDLVLLGAEPSGNTTHLLFQGGWADRLANPAYAGCLTPNEQKWLYRLTEKGEARRAASRNEKPA